MGFEMNDIKRVLYVRASDIYNDSRAIKEISALFESGFFVHIIAWNKTGDAYQRINSLFDSNRFELMLYNCSDDFSSFFKKLFARFRWGRWIKIAVKELINSHHFSASHLCDLDVAFFVRKTIQKKHIPIVYDVYDFYADSHSMPFPINTIIARNEKRIINRSFATIICTEERKKQIKKTHPQKLIIVHNSPDIEPYNETIQEFQIKFEVLPKIKNLRESEESL